MEKAEGLKAEGNTLFAQREYERCVDAYTQALESLRVVAGTSMVYDSGEVESTDAEGDESVESVESVERGPAGAQARLMLQIYANRSLAYLRLGRLEYAAEDGARGLALARVLGSGSISASDRVIADKAAYRRGVALCMLGDVEAGTMACSHVRVDGEQGEAVRHLMDQFDVIKAWGRVTGGDSGPPPGVTPAVSRLVAMLWKDVLGDDDDDQECEENDGVDGAHGTNTCAHAGITDDMSPRDVLERLVELLGISSSQADQFHILSNSRLLFYLIHTPSTRPAACRLLAAIVDVAVVWPRELWEFLTAYACGKKSVGSAREDVEGYARDCMGVLLGVARGNAWVRQWVLTRCWRGGNVSGDADVLEGISIVEMVSKTIGTCHLSANCVGKDAVVAGCGVLAAYAEAPDETSFVQFASLRDAAGVMHMLSAFENAKEIVWGSEEEAGEGATGSDSARLGGDDRQVEDEDENERAKRALIKKQRAVYDPVTVDLQKAILRHVRTVFKCKPLVMSELVEWKGGRKCASQVHHRLVALGNMLVAKCPKRSTKVYDHMMGISSYEKKPYAADIHDNPAGDFLATIDLEGLATASGKDLSQSPLLEEFLETVIVLLEYDSAFITGLLFKAGVLSLCQSVSAFVSPRTVELAQTICSHVVHVVKEAKSKLLESSNVILLSGLLLRRGSSGRTAAGPPDTCAEVDTFALGELACTVPSCSGNDLRYLIDKESGLLVFLCDALTNRGRGKGQDDVAFLTGLTRVTAELAKRSLACGSYRVLRNGNKIPKGYAWGCFDAELLESIMYPKQGAGGVTGGAMGAKHADTQAAELGPGFARGFFPKVRGNAGEKSGLHGPSMTDEAASQSQSPARLVHTRESPASIARAAIESSPCSTQPTPDTTETKPSSSRCEILELNSEDEEMPAPNGAPRHPSPLAVASDAAAAGEAREPATNPATIPATNPATKALTEASTDDSDCELYEVYDSTPAEHIREARAVWMAMDQAEKVTWEQTSSDVVAKVKVPKGTSAKDISVTCTSTSIAVNLKWYGKVLSGDLYGGIKAHEFTWCLNDDSEIYIVLPKDCKEHWWKTLIQGWEEKGYYELLKDAVDADEPHVPYDDMDESAKDLLDSMLERQAYINAGMLDLENGFDDFRIVLSDNSLKETRSS